MLARDRVVSPAEVLHRLDDALAGLGVGAIASVVLARVEQDERTGARRVRWSSAGHPSPLLVGPEGGVQVLDAPGDLLLGVRPDVARNDHVVVVPAGSTLLVHTDGLVERRGEHLQVGIDRLAGALGDLVGMPLQPEPQQPPPTAGRRRATRSASTSAPGP